MFSQNMLAYTRNGSVLYIHCVRSFTVWMYHLILGTCSSCDTILSVIPKAATLPWSSSNWPSPRKFVTLKPHCLHVCGLDLFECCQECHCFLVLGNLCGTKFDVMGDGHKNGILLTYMTSPAIVTFWYRLVMLIGMFIFSAQTCSVVVWVVFSLSEPRFGPNMSSAAMMSLRLIGQVGIRLLSIMWRYDWVLG
jgi:hypothetical protein